MMNPDPHDRDSPDAALSALTPGSDPEGERLGEIEHEPVTVGRAAFEALAAGEG